MFPKILEVLGFDLDDDAIQMESHQLDLYKELDIDVDTATVSDPKVLVEVSIERPTVANPTADNHRFDIIVKNPDQTQFHLGTGAGNGDRIKDTGIVGRTDSHIHWEVRDGGGAPTIISLGESSKDAEVAAPNAFWIPKFGFNGLAAATHGDCAVSAKGFVDVTAVEKDLKLRSYKKNVALEATLEQVQVSGNRGVTVGGGHHVSIHAESGELNPEAEDPRHPIAMGVRKVAGSKVARIFLSVASLTAAVEGLVTSFKPVEKGLDGFKKTISSKSDEDVAKGALDAVKVLFSAARAVDSSDDGKVKIHGDTDVAAAGDRSFSAYGGMAATMSSALTSSVLGTTASLTGLAWAGVWSGLALSLKSRLGDVKIESQEKAASLKAKNDVEILSATGHASMAGKTAQLTATDGLCAVSSGSTVKCVAGGSSGYGAVYHDNGFWLGKIDSKADDYKQATVAKDKCIMQNEKGIKGKFGDRGFELAKTHANVLFEHGHGFIANSQSVMVMSKGSRKILLK